MNNPRKFLTITAFMTSISVGFFILSQTSNVQAASCRDSAVVNRAAIAFMKAARAKSAGSFERALNQHVNMAAVSMFALGKYRSKLPKSKKTRYMRLTSGYVARTLAGYSLKFRAASHKVKYCRKGKVIGSFFSLNGGGKKVIWRLRRGRIVDVNIQNVWLAIMLRNNFSKTLKNNGGNISSLMARISGRRFGPHDRR